MNNLYIRLHNYLYICDHHTADYMIARVLIKEYENLKDILIETIASSANTTPATVTKFVHKLGYKSFKELRKDSTILKTDSSWYKILSKAGNDLVQGEELYLMMVQQHLLEYHKHFDRSMIEKLAYEIKEYKEFGILYPFYSYTSVHAFREYVRPLHIQIHGILRESEMDYIKTATQDIDVIFIICLSGNWLQEHKDMLQELKLAGKCIILISLNIIVPSFIDYNFPILEKGENILDSAMQISYLFALLAMQLSKLSNFGKNQMLSSSL